MALPSFQPYALKAGEIFNQCITVDKFGKSAPRYRGDLLGLFAAINSDMDGTAAYAAFASVTKENGELKYLGGSRADYLARAPKDTVGDVALRVEGRVKPKKGDKSAKAVAGLAAKWVISFARKASAYAGFEGGEELPYSHSALRLVHEFTIVHSYATEMAPTSALLPALWVLKGASDINPELAPDAALITAMEMQSMKHAAALAKK